jgi:hypothetical protein
MYVLHRDHRMYDGPWRRGLVVSFSPATKETGAMGREIESRYGIGQ